MNEPLTVEMTTRTFALGAGRATEPVQVALQQPILPARTLIAEYVRAEVAETERRRTNSLALHYMLADDIQTQSAPALHRHLNVEAEIARAWKGLAERRYMLVVDGVAVDDLDMELALTAHSRISFVRLLPLVGG